MNYFRSQVKVGVFVFSSLAVFVLLVLGVGGFELLRATKDISVYFSFVNGLESDAPVRYAGVKIGKVREITIIKDKFALPDPYKKVKVDIRVLDTVPIDSEAKASVNTLGLMGEKYIELTSGFSEEYLSDGAYILGQDLVSMRELMKTGKNIITTLDHMIVSLDKIVGSKEHQEAFSATIIGAKRSVEQLESFVRHLNKLLNDNGRSIGVITEKTVSAITKLEKLLENTDDIVSTNKTQVNEIISNLNETLKYAKSFAQKIEANPTHLVWKTKKQKLQEKEKRRQEILAKRDAIRAKRRKSREKKL